MRSVSPLAVCSCPSEDIASLSTARNDPLALSLFEDGVLDSLNPATPVTVNPALTCEGHLDNYDEQFDCR